MYKNVTNKYIEQIYKSRFFKINIYIDNVLLNPKYLLGFNKGGDVFNNELELGSTPSQYVEMKIHKKSGITSASVVRIEYGVLINHSLTVEEINNMTVKEFNNTLVKCLTTGDSRYEIIPMGIYNVDDFNDEDDNVINLKLLDNMIKLDADDGYYDASELIGNENDENFGATLGEIFQDICTKKEVECGSTSFLNSNKKVYVYDNQLTAREYVSYIAECAGGIACAGRDGKLYIKSLCEDTAEIPLNLFKTYKFGEEYKISRVAYEDGVRDYKYGNETRNTLWIRQENMFIVDANEVENIYNKVNNLTINSFEGTVIIDPRIDIGDKILVGDKPIIYQGEMSLNGRFLANIKSQIDIKSRQETTVKKESQKVINRRIQSEIDQEKGIIRQLVGEDTSSGTAMAEHIVTASGITNRVELLEESSISSVNVEYALGTSTTTAPITGWSTTAPQWEQGKYMWQRTVITYADSTIEAPHIETSTPTCIAGAKGQDGLNGKGITSIAEYYAVSSSNSIAPTDNDFVTSPIPTMTSTNKYLWNYEIITYTDNTTGVTAKRVIGTYGDKGDTGSTGNGINSVTTTYGISSSPSIMPSSWSSSVPTTISDGDYLWTKTIIDYTDTSMQDTVTYSYAKQGEKGDTGNDGIGISSIVNKYAVSTSNTTAPTNWSNTPGTLTSTDKYLWNYEIITYTNNATYTSTPTVIGVYGQDGDDGIGVSAIVEQYYLSTSNSTQTGGDWQNTQPTWTSGKYIWTRSKITWTDNTTTYTTPILATSINKANETAKSASDTATNVVNNFGTYVEQNYEHVKVAWNTISEFIQMEILNNNPSLTFRQNANALLMALDKFGQHFYKNGNTVFGEIGVKQITENNIEKNFMAFSVPSDYNNQIQDGMAWGITTTSDGVFHPIFFIKNFEIGNQQSSDQYGQLVLDSCDLVLGGIDTGIKAGDILIKGDALNGLSFEDDNGNTFLEMCPEPLLSTDKLINIFGDVIQFVDNGVVKIGNTTDKNGLFFCFGYSSFYRDVSVDGNVYADNISSDKRIKKNIRKSTKKALDIIKKIKHRQFDKKSDNSHYDIGYIAQEMEAIDPNFVLKRQATKELEERYYINELPIIATISKAIQEQQEEIEQLQTKDKEKDKIIQDLIQRIETLEKGVNE